MSIIVSQPKRVFVTVWFGQLVSALGTGLSGFALGVFVYQLTGSTTQFALVSVCTMVPSILLTPFAGALADRWDRRGLMLLSNVVAGLVVLLLAVLKDQEALRLWNIYAAVAVIAMCGALRDPAYYASVSQLVPKKQLGRATGLVQSGENIGLVAPPVVAGILVVSIGLPGVLIIDLLTYVVGVAATLIVRFPELNRESEEDGAGSSLWRDTVAGWNYIVTYRGLLFLFLVGAATSFSVGLAQIVMTPLVLSFASPAFLGAIFSVGGLGIFLGGAAMAAWGGPKRRALGVLVFGVAQSISLLVVGFKASTVLISVGIFGYLFAIQFVRGCTAVIIRTHVPDAMQARVFALNRFVAWSTLPLSYLLAGPLVNVFEPLLRPSGSLAGSVGEIIGVGSGRGMAFLLITIGVGYLVVVVASYLNPRMRNVEQEMTEAAARSAEPPAAEVVNVTASQQGEPA